MFLEKFNNMDEKKYNIDIHVLCWNEMQLAPFMVDYWKRIARHVYVYDNYSDDGVDEYLGKYEWITVKKYESGNELNDKIYLKIKDNCWKGSDADWVWVSDFDEAPYSNNFFEEVEILENNGITAVEPNWIETLSYTNIPEYQEGKLLHELIDGGIGNSPYSITESKTLFFKPGKINNTNYDPGCHKCRLEGQVKKDRKLNCIHFKNLGLEYVIERYKKYSMRMSAINKKFRWGYQYCEPENIHKEWFEKNYETIKPVKDLLL